MTNVHVTIPVEVFREGDAFVARSPAFDLVTQGDSLDRAKRRFEEVVELFLEECINRGTLRDVLIELGWKESVAKQTWEPPVLVEHSTQQVKISVA